MKNNFLICLMVTLGFCLNPLNKVIASNSLKGKWYGTKYGGLVTLEFRDDQKIAINTEAFSSLSFSCKYRIDSSASPVAIDLIDIPGGMSCSAIIKLSANNELEFFGFFGPPGYVQRPSSVDSDSKRLDAIYLKLSRDSNNTMSKTTFSPPKSAQLAFERNKRLGRGLNLNGLLDNNSGELHLYSIADQPIKPEYIKMIANAGFNSVRLPVTWSVHCSKNAPYTIDASFFARVDSIIKLCLKNNLAVSIDIHYYPYINMSGNDSTISFENNIKRFYLLWKQISTHYKNYPPELYFDILNEPNMDMSLPFYNDLVRKSIKLIRETNPTRTIIVGTPNLGQSWTIGLLDLPNDDWNLIVQMHYYLPHLFTHQGLGYANAATSKGTQWFGTNEEKMPIISDFNYCAKWSKEHQRPINLGEFGVNESADIESRARYINFIRSIADERKFSFHIWGFREIFRIFDEEKGKWQQPIVEALIPKK